MLNYLWVGKVIVCSSPNDSRFQPFLHLISPGFTPGCWLVRVAHLFSFLCCVFHYFMFALVLCIVYTRIRVSLDCPFFIARSAFSSIYSMQCSNVSGSLSLYLIFNVSIFTINFMIDSQLPPTRHWFTSVDSRAWIPSLDCRFLDPFPQLTSSVLYIKIHQRQSMMLQLNVLLDKFQRILKKYSPTLTSGGKT